MIQKNQILQKIKYSVYFVLVVLAFSCNRKVKYNSISITKGECSKLFNNYLTSLSAGDSSAVKTFWSQKSLKRQGFWTIHNYFSPWGDHANWKTIATGSIFEVQDLKCHNDYCIAETKWIPKDTSMYKIRKLKYYIINENNSFVLINPIDFFTGNWKLYSTKHIVFHYPPEIEINNYIDEIHYAEKEFSKALELFDVQLDRKIDFYKARNDRECGKLMNFGPVNGYVLMPQKEESSFGKEIWFVASSSFVNHHEFIHVITGLLGIPFDNPSITEGLACAFAGGFHTKPEFVINDARNQIIQSFHYPLRELLTMDEQTFSTNNYIGYAQSGSFIKYLYDQYGIEKLKELCFMPLSQNEIISTIESNYGKTFDEIEKDWVTYLLTKEIPEIGTSIPGDAKTVFSMSDVVGDDTGDGDYTYPKYDDYPPGCFDLKNFEVLKDKSNTYFRIEFAKLKKPLVFGEDNRAEKFVVGCIIAIQQGKNKKMHRQKYCHGVKFSNDEGYDLKVNVGTNVSLTNNFGETVFSSPEIVNKISDYQKNTIKFSVSSDLIGTPVEDWKYFVGTCLISNRIMNFLGEPVQVYKNPPYQVFIGGGNYDFGNPAYMDLLLPEGKNQTEILSAYSTNIDSSAIVPMVGH
ncbi:MAG: glucodextranase DOMON-like domain-containing protein [Bacteroidota bacterium]